MSNIIIPQDLVPNILSRLPVKSLTRFKCVSKSWCQMIDTPGFIKTHLEQSKSNIKFISEVSKTGGAHLYDVGFTLDELPKEEIKYPVVILDAKIYRITIAGSCNGLVCLVYYPLHEEKTTIVLWNPSTRKHLQLPIFPMETYRVRNHGFGFGYDKSTDDYKVVRLATYEDFYDKSFDEISIFSLKSNKWKNLEGFRFGNNFIMNNVSVLAKGTLHWLLRNNSILAFNLETDDIQLLPPPDTSTSIKCACLSVAFVNGCQNLVFEDTTHTREGQKWITQDKCGSNYSWTKLTYDFLSGEQLLIVRMPCYRNSYDMIMFEKKLEVEFPFRVQYLQAHLYLESLVRLDDACEKNDVTLIEEQVDEGRKRKKMDDMFIESYLNMIPNSKRLLKRRNWS